MSREYDVLVVGDSNIDVQIGRSPAELAFGQEEQLMDSGALTLGGSAAITACGVARLGLRTTLVSVVGDDGAGRLVLSELAARRIEVSNCVVDEHLATGITVNLVRGPDRAMLTYAGAMSTTSATMVPRELLTASRHVHVSSLFLQPRLAVEVGNLFAEAHRSGASTSLDTGWDPTGRWECGLARVLPHVDVLLPNRQEALAIASVLDGAGRPLGRARRSSSSRMSSHGSPQTSPHSWRQRRRREIAARASRCTPLAAPAITPASSVATSQRCAVGCRPDLRCPVQRPSTTPTSTTTRVLLSASARVGDRRHCGVSGAGKGGRRLHDCGD